jgi:hypothetical protein
MPREARPQQVSPRSRQPLRTADLCAGARRWGLLFVTGFPPAFVLGWQSSRLPTDYVSMAKVSCCARGDDPVLGRRGQSHRGPRRAQVGGCKPMVFLRSRLLPPLYVRSSMQRHGISVDDRGDLPKVRWTPDRRNPRAQHAGQVADVAASVADDVKSAAADGQADAVLVLGGDCTIEVGVVSGFTRPGERVGLIYLDAGPDLNVPSAVRLGFLDWMVTAHLLGLPEVTRPLSHIGPRFPLLDPDQIVFVGASPTSSATGSGKPWLPAPCR